MDIVCIIIHPHNAYLKSKQIHLISKYVRVPVALNIKKSNMINDSYGIEVCLEMCFLMFPCVSADMNGGLSRCLMCSPVIHLLRQFCRL